MGVKGLLGFLKKCIVNIHLRNFSGYVFAIDGYCWLHRSLFSCAMDIGLGKKTDRHINYIIKFLTLLLENNIKPILVFDGKNLLSKRIIETNRRKKKVECKKKAMEYLLAGDMKKARDNFEQCIEVTTELAHQALRAAREMGVDCIVAPYEADAQLMFLFSRGFADVIVTQDSDLITFGCRQVLFKLDLDGNGDLFTWSSGMAEKCCNIKSELFTEDTFRQICILSGCDYFPGIPGIGLLTACKIMSKARYTSFRELLENLGIYTKLNAAAQSEIPQLDLLCEQIRNKIQDSNDSEKVVHVKGKLNAGMGKLPQSTIEAAVCAEMTFKYQVAFDPRERRQVRLAQSSKPEQELHFAGVIDEDKEASLEVALGNVDCVTGNRFDDFKPDKEFFDRVKVAMKKYSQSLSSSKGQQSLKQICLKFEPLSNPCSINSVKSPSRNRLNLSIWDVNYPLRKVWLNFSEHEGLYCHVVGPECDLPRQVTDKENLPRKSIKRDPESNFDLEEEMPKKSKDSRRKVLQEIGNNDKLELFTPIKVQKDSTIQGKSVYFQNQKKETDLKEFKVKLDTSPSLSSHSSDEGEALNRIIASAAKEPGTPQEVSMKKTLGSPISPIFSTTPVHPVQRMCRNIFSVNKQPPPDSPTRPDASPEEVDRVPETCFDEENETADKSTSLNKLDIFQQFAHKKPNVGAKSATRSQDPPEDPALQIFKDSSSFQSPKQPLKEIPAPASPMKSPIISRCGHLSPPLPDTPPLDFDSSKREEELILTPSSDITLASKLLNPNLRRQTSKKNVSAVKATKKMFDPKQGNLRDFFKQFTAPTRLIRDV